MNTTITLLIGTGLAIGVICFAIGVYLVIMRMRGVTRLADMPGVGEISTLQAGISMLSVGGYCFWHAALTYAPILHGVELESKFNRVLITTSQQIRDEYRRAVNAPSPAARSDAFARVSLLLEILNHLDNSNGHAHYFAGEVKRAQGNTIDAHKDFYRYFEILESSHIVEDSGDTGSEFCYAQPRGFCRQRSGWMRHLLADDYFHRGQEASDAQEKLIRFETALKHAEAALRDYPGGFDGLRQGLPTRLIVKGASEQIAQLQRN